MSATATATRKLGIPSDDMADIVIQHCNGARSTIHLDYLTRPRRRRLEIVGANGILEADLRANFLRIAGHDDQEIETIEVTTELNEEYISCVADFLLAVTKKGTPACPGREALSVLELALEARKLSRLPS